MSRPAPLTLLFAILFAGLVISPALFSSPFGPYPLIKVGDVIDLFTPLVLIPIYWLLFQGQGVLPPPRLGEALLFLGLAALWVEGQGMHLGANSIGHLLRDFPGTDAERVTHFYDEELSHYMWHAGAIGLAALLIVRHWPAAPSAGLAAPIAAGVIHGLTYFITVVEAGTAPLGIPFAVGVVLFGLIWGRRRLAQKPVPAFFFVTYLLATLLFLGWALYWGGLPQFSEVGIIQ